ncbi:MAG TPA: oxidoreductase [Solibacterales bacterium]|nr:oxidoreductase [Bryobacterales bacterium]
MVPAMSTLTRRALVSAAAVLPGLRAQPSRVRIGIAGGRFGATFQWHLDPGCEVAAVCDIADAPLDRLATIYRCPNTYKSFDALLKHPQLDAVGVFTPAPLHAEMAIAALKAGKHVISAVPAGLSVEELEEILATVRSTGLKYMMAETSYYLAPVIRCREMAAAGEFGTLFYAESEYHHEGLIDLMHNPDGTPTWRHGYPPMLYPTHCTGMIVPVMGERLTEVTATGWGDNHVILRSNRYKNPFWNETAFFKTSGGHAARVAVYWHAAAGVVERGQFLGDRMSYFMHRPEGSPDTIVRIAKDGRTELDSNNYPAGKVEIRPANDPDYFDRLPEPMRVKTGHGNSHTFLTHEFISAIREDRHPAVHIWEAIAYTLPGIIAHQSALKGGVSMKIRDYGPAA